MKLLRLAWSGYQTEQNLAAEKKAVEELGMGYKRSRINGRLPENSDEFSILLINSQFKITANFIKKWPEGKLIITASSGYNHIDLHACRKAKITVARTAKSRARRVRDHTKTLIFALLRDIPLSHNRLRNHQWTRTDSFERVKDPARETLGVFGFGLIGSRVADYFKDVFKRPVLVCDPLKENIGNKLNNIKFCSIKELLKDSSIISIHADLNFSSRNLINKQSIRLLKKGTLLVNTARGKMIDYTDLISGLKSGKIGGAALDVFPEEPPGEETEVKHDKLLLTPHSAGFGPGLLDDLRSELIELLTEWQAQKPLSQEIKPLTENQIDLLKKRTSL